MQTVRLGWSFRGAPALILLLASGCIGGVPRAQAMRADKAYLTGYVAEVDNAETRANGRAIELAPGCHVVTTPSEWGGVGTDSALIVKTGRAHFVIDMQPGYRYEVVVGTGAANELQMKSSLEATERDAKGNVTRTFPAYREARCGS
jgi:hypothetical protein